MNKAILWDLGGTIMAFMNIIFANIFMLFKGAIFYFLVQLAL